MAYAAVETSAGWEIMLADGNRLRVGSALDETSRVLTLGSRERCERVLRALADGELEPSGLTPGGDPVIDIDEYVPWREDMAGW